MNNQNTSPDQQEINSRSLFLTLILACALSLLVLRLGIVQIWNYGENAKKSESNRIRKQVQKAPRGRILDRTGEVLVRNRPSYHVVINGSEVLNQKALFESLLRIRTVQGDRIFDSTLIDRRLQQTRWRKFSNLRILEDAPLEVISVIEEHQDELLGALKVVEARREYPFGTLAAHTLGYTGELTEKDLDRDRYSDYNLRDRVGKKGLERVFQEEFRGRDGLLHLEVNAYGKRLGVLKEMPNKKSIPGLDLLTTIDLDLQLLAEKVFPDTLKGALVALNPQNGEILAIVSKPEIDPNIFSLAKNYRKKEWASVALDSNRPLNNRAVVGTYPPGSLFKFFTAIAGIEEGAITMDDKKYKPCRGGFKFGRRYQKCWKASGHGHNNVIDALRESCDTYFYQLGLELGMRPINRIARMYGLGSPSGIDLPIEKRGLLMDSMTYNKRFKRLGWTWTRGQILNLSIGQGELVTPLQMANAFGALAHGKALFKPHLFKELHKKGRILEKYESSILQEINISEAAQKMVLKSLEEVITAPGGTGGAARVPGVRVGGKTGSAENPHGELTHAWFGAVAPLDKPTIAIAVLVENAGHGGSIAAPIAGEVLRHYFQREAEGGGS